jgi:hypothetical protein
MERHLNHKLLRENKNLEDMSPSDRQIMDYEVKIKQDRLARGNKEIEELRKILDGVAVYQEPKNVEILVKEKDPEMIKFQPAKIAEI